MEHRHRFLSQTVEQWSQHAERILGTLDQSRLSRAAPLHPTPELEGRRECGRPRRTPAPDPHQLARMGAGKLAKAPEPVQDRMCQVDGTVSARSAAEDQGKELDGRKCRDSQSMAALSRPLFRGKGTKSHVLEREVECSRLVCPRPGAARDVRRKLLALKDLEPLRARRIAEPPASYNSSIRAGGAESGPHAEAARSLPAGGKIHLDARRIPTHPFTGQ